MNLKFVSAIMLKDLRVALKRRGLVIGLLVFPLIVAVGLPAVLTISGRNGHGLPAVVLPQLLSSFQFFFVIGSVTLPTAIAAFSLVGEKIERSLEPLLATPVTDIEILIGKALAAWLPPVIAAGLGNVLFMVLANMQTQKTLGYLFFPNPTAFMVLFVVIPLSAMVSVGLSVLVSSRVRDARTAQQISSILALPFAGIYITTEVGIVSLDVPGMLTLGGILLILVAILFVLARATFNREEILTRWK